ncbi:hypothetical protein [Streptomyces inusitatus]|nr:hypothetical protein [Streptomyces inusitatus]
MSEGHWLHTATGVLRAVRLSEAHLSVLTSYIPLRPWQTAG